MGTNTQEPSDHLGETDVFTSSRDLLEKKFFFNGFCFKPLPIPQDGGPCLVVLETLVSKQQHDLKDHLVICWGLSPHPVSKKNHYFYAQNLQVLEQLLHELRHFKSTYEAELEWGKLLRNVQEWIAERMEWSQVLSSQFFEEILIMIRTAKTLVLAPKSIVSSSILDELGSVLWPEGRVKLLAWKSAKVEILKNKKNDEVILPFTWNGERYLALASEEMGTKVMCFTSLLNSFFTYNSFSDQKKMAQDFLLSLIPVPYALLTQDKLRLFNQGFAEMKLLLKDFKDLKDGETFSSSGRLILVRNREFNYDGATYQLYSFQEVKSREGKSFLSPRELGIVTSSMAHELNNPLAGILSAISVLELEESWDQESREILSELRVVSLRCKELIQVFLGFSKNNLTQNSPPCMEDLLRSSMGLLRFRSVELNTILELTCGNPSHRNFILNGNSSVLTMIFYLFFSELLTGVSHLELIKGNTMKRTIPIAFRIEQDGVIFLNFSDKINSLVPTMEPLMRSKLFIHLLELSHLEVRLVSEGVHFIFNPEDKK